MNPEARAALEALDKERGGNLTTEAVREAALSEDSPLHPYFTWDRDAAAYERQLEQARHLIQKYRVVFVAPNQVSKSVRGYASIKRPAPGGGSVQQVFVRTEVVLTDGELRVQLLDGLRRDVLALQNKYGHLEEFAQVLLEAVQETATV